MTRFICYIALFIMIVSEMINFLAMLYGITNPMMAVSYLGFMIYTALDLLTLIWKIEEEE